MEDCIFCKIVKGEIPPGLGEVYNDKNFLGFLDIKPLVKGHALIIPKKHFKTMLDMPSSLGVELLDAIKDVTLDLIKENKGEAVNIHVNNGESAGQVVHHLHVHIVPRKKGDGLMDKMV